MIKAVIFDWGNVLYGFDNQIFLKNLKKHTPLSVDELQRRIYESPEGNAGLLVPYETGRITTEQFCQGLIDLCGLNANPEEVADAFTSGKCWPIQETIDLLPKLKRNFKLGLLTNTEPLDFDGVVRGMRHFNLFDAVSTSHEVGVKKPDELIYRDMLNKLGLEANQCIYMDDIREQADAARNLGMRAIHHVSYGSTIGELKSTGIQI